MKSIINICIVNFTVLLIACGPENNDCDRSGFSTLYLHPANCTLEIPEYRIKDSVRYGGNENELTYNVEALDSTIEMTCFVTSFKTDNGYAGFDMDVAMKFQKGELLFGIKSPKLIAQQIKYVDSVKVGYLKCFIETETDKFYEGRIFFFRNKKFVNIYLTENYRGNKVDSMTISDCIYKSIVLK